MTNDSAIGEPTRAPSGTAAGGAGWPRVVLPLVVAGLAFWVMSPALEGEFVNLDDRVNFVSNSAWRGVGAEQLTWMFTHLDGHYQPVTWLSHGIDYALFGLNPYAFHLVNLLFHSMNAVLVYWIFFALFGRVRSLRAARGTDALRFATAAGALLFAVHPLRVEAVAWITERRAVLFLFFVLVSLLFYLKSNEEGVQPGERLRALVVSVSSFALAMLSNALCMTLPVLLLLLDTYPLGRIRGTADLLPRLREKLPYFAVTIIGIVIQLSAQSAGEAIDPESTYTVADMLTQPGHRLVFYLQKTVAPVGLYPMYLLPLDRDPFSAAHLLAGGAVVIITAVLFVLARRAPALLTSWLAFGLLLSPVLGLIQVGYHFASDRNAYFAGLVPAALIAGGLARLLVDRRGVWLAAGAALALIVVLAGMSHRQSQTWISSTAMWRHALEHDAENYFAHYNLAHELQAKGELDSAIDHYTRAIFARGDDARLYYNRGVVWAEKREYKRAIPDFDRAIELDPEHWRAFNNRGVTHLGRGDFELAIADFSRAIELAPEQAQHLRRAGAGLRGDRLAGAGPSRPGSRAASARPIGAGIRLSGFVTIPARTRRPGRRDRRSARTGLAGSERDRKLDRNGTGMRRELT